MIDFKDFHEKLLNLANILFAFSLILPVFGLIVYGVDVEVSMISGVMGEVSLFQFPILPYLAGFIIISVQWAKYIQLHQNLKKIDTLILTINFVYLFFLCLYPFSEMNIEFTSNNALSRVVFSLHWSILGIIIYYMIHYSQKKQFFMENFDKKKIRKLKQDIISDPIVAIITVPLAFLGFWYWFTAMVILVPVFTFMQSKVNINL